MVAGDMGGGAGVHDPIGAWWRERLAIAWCTLVEGTVIPGGHRWMLRWCWSGWCRIDWGMHHGIDLGGHTGAMTKDTRGIRQNPRGAGGEGHAHRSEVADPRMLSASTSAMVIRVTTTTGGTTTTASTATIVALLGAVLETGDRVFPVVVGTNTRRTGRSTTTGLAIIA